MSFHRRVFTHVRGQPPGRFLRLRRELAAASVLMLVATVPSAAAADDDGGPVNVYMTGAEVRIDRGVEGDLVVAAGRIHVDQPVAGDAVLGAGSVDVQAPVGEDLRAAGGIVTVADRVQGEVLVVAARIIMSPASEVYGRTWLAAASVTLGGRALSAVKVYAREVAVLGEIYGPLEVSADRIEIRAGARVHGDLTYSGANEIVIHPQAQVTGKITRTPGTLDAHEPAAIIPGLKPLRPLLVAALFAAGVLLHVLFRSFMANTVRTLGAVPVKSVALGTALFFSVPPVAVLLVITIIGIPIGVALLAAHAVALLVGYLVTASFIAAKLGRALHAQPFNGWRQYALLAGAVVLVALATSIAYAGPLILLLACAAGLGATLLQRFSRRSETRTAENPDTWPAA